jgi:hypothetical protein
MIALANELCCIVSGQVFECRSETSLRKHSSLGNRSRPPSIAASGQSGAGRPTKASRFIGWDTKSTIPSSRTSMRSKPGPAAALGSRGMTSWPVRYSFRTSRSTAPAYEYLVEHDAITRTMDRYIAGARAGDGELMRAAFHPEATTSGYCQGWNTVAPLSMCSNG